MTQTLRHTRARGVLIVVIDRERDVGRIAWPEAQRGARRPLVAAVDVVAGVEILCVAVALIRNARDAQRGLFAERQVDRALALQLAVVAGLEFDIAAELADLRLLRQHVDGAARGIAAVQRALRPAQHFDALDVEILGFEDAGILQRHRVEVRFHAGVRTRPHRRHADAADLEVRAGEIGLAVGDVGNVELQVGRLIDLSSRQCRLVEGRYGDRHIDEVLLLLLCRDDDGVDQFGFSDLLGLGRLRKSERGCDGQRQRACTPRREDPLMHSRTPSFICLTETIRSTPVRFALPAPITRTTRRPRTAGVWHFGRTVQILDAAHERGIQRLLRSQHQTGTGQAGTAAKSRMAEWSAIRSQRKPS